MTTDKEFMSYIVSLSPKKPMAILASTSKKYPKKMPYYAGALGEGPHETPAANILHNVDKITHDMTLYLNYKPSDIELGMAWRAGEIHNVFFVESHEPLIIGQYKIDVDGFKLHTPCELADIKQNDGSVRVALENSKLAEAINVQKQFTQRRISPPTIEALGRGLNSDYSVMDDRDQRKIDEDFMRIAVALVDRGWNSQDASTKPADRVAGNNIGAIMVDKDNKIIGWGLNLKSENKTFHAESLMIQRYLKENNTDRLPDGARIYTSLECCHMCSAHITTLGRDIKVFYAQKDPYFNGKNTLALGKNNCSQERTTLSFPDIFKTAMQDQENILDFLFSKKAKSIFSKGYQEAALFIELAEVVAKRKYFQELQNNKSDSPEISPAHPTSIIITVSPILQYGEHFFQALGDYSPHVATGPSINFFRSRPSSPNVSPRSSPFSSSSSSPISSSSSSPFSSSNSSPFSSSSSSPISSSSSSPSLSPSLSPRLSPDTSPDLSRNSSPTLSSIGNKIGTQSASPNPEEIYRKLMPPLKKEIKRDKSSPDSKSTHAGKKKKP